MSSVPNHNFQRPFSLPPGASEILLVRHGSAATRREGNEPFGLLDGHSDPPLSSEGRQQAQAVCRRLSNVRIDAMFVTSLRRTAETAAPLEQELGMTATVVPELREVHLGEWEGEFGRRIAGRDPDVETLFSSQRWDAIPDAEPMEHFQARVSQGIARVAELTGADRTAVAFVHGGVIAEVCRMVTACQPFAFLYADNGSVTRIARLRSGRWVIRGFNDISHL